MQLCGRLSILWHCLSLGLEWKLTFCSLVASAAFSKFGACCCLVKDMFFPVVMYGCESWTIKKAEWWRIDAFELWCWRRLLKSPLDCKAIQTVHPKGNQQSWMFIGRTDVEAETPILWPPDVKNWLIGEKKKKPWCWERLKAGGEGDNRGWEG